MNYRKLSRAIIQFIAVVVFALHVGAIAAYAQQPGTTAAPAPVTPAPSANTPVQSG
ncbi:MAG: hypothetical protein ICV68_10515, partial [Pyrinomonadaceae bacterium]|nr:hypothetical protein [Pyrinomonadaceae bacterium]